MCDRATLCTALAALACHDTTSSSSSSTSSLPAAESHTMLLWPSPPVAAGGDVSKPVLEIALDITSCASSVASRLKGA